MKIGQFEIITKPKGNLDQVYEEILIPHFQDIYKENTGFFLETWGRPYMESVCDKGVKNQLNNITLMDILGHEFRNTQDHAKWAISVSRKTALVCYSDLNHMDSQKKRGGTFYCIKDKNVYGLMADSIKATECGWLPEEENENQTGSSATHKSGRIPPFHISLLSAIAILLFTNNYIF